MSIDMDEIRNACADRIVAKCEGLTALGKAMDAIDGADNGPNGERMNAYGRNSLAAAWVAGRTVLAMLHESIMTDLGYDIDQYAGLVVRDVIAPVARESEHPIEWLTSNRYMPAIRDLDRMDDFYTAIEDGHVFAKMAHDVWVMLVEAIESECEKQQIFMASPEWDNALYVVDLKRWELSENEDGDNMNDDWVPVAVPQMD